jgi:hypothetical protein
MPPFPPAPTQGAASTFLPESQSTTYPGVVMSAFASDSYDAMDFLGGGADMDEIVAAGASGSAGRNGSASGNIAPWLMDDQAVSLYNSVAND